MKKESYKFRAVARLTVVASCICFLGTAQPAQVVVVPGEAAGYLYSSGAE